MIISPILISAEKQLLVEGDSALSENVESSGKRNDTIEYHTMD